MLNKKLNVLIVGSGMYVSGRGTDSHGTIFPAIGEAIRLNKIASVSIATTSFKSSKNAKNDLEKLLKIMGVNIEIHFFPKVNNDKKAYISAIKNKKPDLAIIAVPDHLHSSITIDLMKKNIHCLVVKPLTNSFSDAKKMILTKNKLNLIGEVEFHKRYDQANLMIKNSILNNEFGDLQYAVVEYSQKKIIPLNIFKKWSEKSNIFQYLGVHYVDLIYWMTNFIPIEVTAWGQKEYLKKNNINTWDSIQVVIKWKKNNKKNSNFISTHISNWIDPNKSSAMSDQKISIIGTNGRVVSDQKNRGLQYVTDNSGVKDINPYFTTSIKNNENNLSFNGYGIESIMSFLNIVLKFNKEKKYISLNRPTFEQSLISTSVIEAANKSLKNKNKTIFLNK
jgi:predicted dehydrogenase